MGYSYKRFASSAILLLIRQLHKGTVTAAYKSNYQCAGLGQARLTAPPETSVRWILPITRRHHPNSSQCTVKSSTYSIKHEAISRSGGVTPRILWQAGTWSASHPDRGKTPPRWALGPFRTLWGKKKCPAPASNRNTVPRVSILPDSYVLIIIAKKQKSQNPSLCGFL